ncbi:hypothetical protein [Acinetobacter sp. MD2(2019)]|uniref:hypothetical protein n=1 Tax=Acinetobacter sp. MD2(2019) TaxID=2605273 RepID=UPI002D1F23F5|nr:hypothetical protein [Acinetobacter sp. MD2(2019)]MEB3753453.1 hypothetical protein [Acinetobacter sp. MD2(2019)]
MKKYLMLTGLSLMLSSQIYATTPNAQTNASTNTQVKHLAPVCLIEGVPTTAYTEIKRIKIAKGTFGSVTDLYPRIQERAQHLGATAIINYHSTQRFGFWPWRFVRPVMTGTAVKWQSNTAPDCKTLGGLELKGS